MANLQVKHLFKIFGPRDREVLPLVKEGKGKEEILQQTNHTVGIADITFTVQAGDIFVVMGLSGSGKSTLIRCLNRLIEPTAGEVIMDEVDILSLSRKQLQKFRRQRVSMVFQHFGLLPHRTVLQNVAYGLTIQKIARRERERRACKWIDTVGLAGYEDSYPNELSGGMQQRVGLARALATDSDILLMDEPFSALDPLIRTEMQDELNRLQKQLHKTIVFITHDLDEALRLGDRIAILDDGIMVQEGDQEDILLRPADDYVAAFIRNVNRGRVLKVRTVMTQPHTAVLKQGNAKAVFEQVRRSDYGPIYVIDQQGHFLGVTTWEDVQDAAHHQKKAPNGWLHSVPTVSMEEVLEDVLLLLPQTPWPIPVVNNDGVLEGVVIQNALFAVLAGNRDSTSLEEKG